MQTASTNKPVIIDAEQPPSSIKIPKFYEDSIESVLVPEKDIVARIKDLSEEIAAFYQDRPYIILVVLKGSFLVFTELYQNLMGLYTSGKHNNKIVPEFIRISTLENEDKEKEVMMKGVDE